MRKVLLFFLFITILSTRQSVAEQDAFIVLSQDIIPYHKASEGVKDKLPGFHFQEYTLENENSSGEKLLKVLTETPPKVMIAVGPEAAYLLKRSTPPCPRVFTMILNPETIFGNTLTFSGVSMNYPPAILLSQLKRVFPDRRKVGIFYSPELNSSLVEKFEKESETLGLKIRPFSITSSSEIRSILKSPTFDPEVILFIPDRVVIKEKVVTYIIEECLFRKTPAVGFNTWFAKNGAAMACYLDYEEIGWQTAELALKLLENKNLQPWIEAPKNLKIILNLKVARKFKITISEKIRTEADEIIE
jgi:putative ABC transport system substrate-binding protein